MVRKRVSFSISSDPDTVEGKLVNFLRDHKMLNIREAVVRALNAYYLPWAYEDEVSKEEAQVLARNAIDELEFRIFQIRRHFLQGEAYGPKLGAEAGSPVVVPSEPVNSNGAKPKRSRSGAIPKAASKAELKAMPTAVLPMLRDTEIDPAILDDF